MTPAQQINKGAHTGWCNRCGGDTFNWIRHRCPKGIDKKTARVCHAASWLVRKREDVRTASHGSIFHAQAVIKEREAFDALAAAVAELNLGNTNGEER